MQAMVGKEGEGKRARLRDAAPVVGDREIHHGYIAGLVEYISEKWGPSPESMASSPSEWMVQLPVINSNIAWRNYEAVFMHQEFMEIKQKDR
ncbi:hypothetical protein RHGRI_019052 [Rhododendron griersonianum]|uniref:Uncharacterized protein n=1 Tax=Rhododendron griersonianum TaxID=479676 RepID=A0AAV6JC54_9ERIC|nr:hypothetical protein RHGRI_019052 [Rhododendron griersonianum]